MKLMTFMAVLAAFYSNAIAYEKKSEPNATHCVISDALKKMAPDHRPSRPDTITPAKKSRSALDLASE